MLLEPKSSPCANEKVSYKGGGFKIPHQLGKQNIPCKGVETYL